MDNSTEPNDIEQDLDKANSKKFSFVLRLSVVGWVVFILLAFIATMTLSFETGDSAGIGFYLFAFLSYSVLIISNSIAIVIGTTRIIDGLSSLKHSVNFKENIENEITKYIALIIGILIASRIAFNILEDAW